ncbi:MAG: hypothetical protein EXS48_03705 [Candidatus Staskawiczbacteria bacterium]|nr:hypothetical protein [Candidatus Staskawiczbacteria bacterium]
MNNQLINGTAVTVDFPRPKSFWKNDFIKILICLGIAITCFANGILFGRFIWPRYVIAEKVIVVKEKPVIVAPNKWNIELDLEVERKVNQRADEKMKMILENCLGVLEIKDGEAQTVRYKKAAIGKKGGFSDIKKDVPYTVYGYTTHNKIGRAIVSDDDWNIFQLDWHPGLTPAPEKNPGIIRVISGKRIGIGK